MVIINLLPCSGKLFQAVINYKFRTGISSLWYYKLGLSNNYCKRNGFIRDGDMQKLRAENPGYSGLGLPLVWLSAEKGEKAGSNLYTGG
jgi:hypothetical protein